MSDALQQLPEPGRPCTPRGLSSRPHRLEWSTRSDCAKMASPMRNVERSGSSAATDDEKPGLSFRFQAPGGVWRQIDPLEREVRVGRQKSSRVGQPVGVT